MATHASVALVWHKTERGQLKEVLHTCVLPYDEETDDRLSMKAAAERYFAGVADIAASTDGYQVVMCAVTTFTVNLETE